MADFVLIDTSSWIEALQKFGDTTVRDRVRKLLLDGQAALCDMVMLELWNGAQGDPERRMLRELEQEMKFLPTTPEVWTLAKTLAIKCRKSGKTVPSTDLLIAACGFVNNASIEHHDRYYDTINQIYENNSH